MNLELLESFGQNYPEEADGQLDCSSSNALCCRFNRWGSLLAVGCNDGKVAVVDFLTRGVTKLLSAHVLPVTTVSWSRSGRKLLTASMDNTVALWDVLKGECEKRYRFSTHVSKTQFHPRDESRFLVCPLKMQAVLIDANDGSHRTIPTEDEQASAETVVVGCFDRRGAHIIMGNGKGKISVFDSDSLELKAWVRLQSSHAIRTLTACRRADSFACISGDRIVRVYDLREMLLQRENTLTPVDHLQVQKLQDMVNKTPWKTCCLSGDGEYVCAGSAKSHSLYLWERASGSLVKILNGTKGEILMDVECHPVRPLICSVANGVVSVWAQSHVENWSAFAPDFKELDENVECDERESEFDLEDEDKSVSLEKSNKPNEDEFVDVIASTAAQMCSSDEEDNEPVSTLDVFDSKTPLWFLPTAPEIEQPEESPYQPGISPDGQKPSGVDGGRNQSFDPSPTKRPHRPKTYDIGFGSNPASNPFVAPSSSGGGSAGGRKRSHNPTATPRGKPKRTNSK